jgi:hypothetical protein
VTPGNDLVIPCIRSISSLIYRSSSAV